MESSLDEPPSRLLAEIFINGDWLFLLMSSFSLLFLLCLSALISGSEVAFFSLTPKDIASCNESERSSDRKIVRLIKHPKLLLATILIGNNFVNVAFVILFTYAFSKTLSGLWSVEVEFIINTSINLILLVLFGEILPKVYAGPNNLRFARITSGLIRFLASIFRPLSWMLMSLSSIIEKRFKTKGYDISVEELHHALELTTKNEDTTEEEKDILKGIVNFGTLTVTQVMKSRMDITAFDTEMDFHDLMDKINKSGFSRVPVYSDTIDSIEGILYIKDLLPYTEQEDDFKWLDLLRPGFFVPETKKIDSLLRDFQEKRVHMAIVVDEYGGTSGLITLEDIIEEIVGEINDEFDNESLGFNKIDDRTYVFESKTTLNDFCKWINESPATFEAIKGESESLGGLLLEINGRLPSAGEKIEYDKYTFTVIAVDNKRIKRVKVQINLQNA
ncbi:MAG: gliding motility-associated protein GldE [Bacteroidota bacterium]